MNYLFFSTEVANIVKKFILIINQTLITVNAKDFNADFYCSDFFNESNGISNFDGFFLYHSKGIVVLSLNLKRYFTCDHFL